MTRIMCMGNLACVFILMINVISSGREFGVGVGEIVDMDSSERKLGLSYLSMAAHPDFYSTYQCYNTGLVLHVSDNTGLVLRVSDSKGHIISATASDATQIGAIESFASGWKWKFLQNKTSIKQAKEGIFDLCANDTLWAPTMTEERVAIWQQQLTAFGHLSESFNSTNPYAGSYGDLISEIFSRNIDKAVADTEITTNRLRFRWRFLKPITREIWLTTIALFLLTGAAVHIAGEGGRDVNRLEYFSMTIFDPRHAREILNIDDKGGGSSCGGYSSAARDQPPEIDSSGGRQRWWKKVWRLLKPTTQQHS